jgi:hypothetical protein
MKNLLLQILPACVLVFGFCGISWAQRTPGEDPLTMNGPVSFMSLPSGGSPKSTGLDTHTDMPAWLKAKVARFEAKAYSAGLDDGTLLTDNDVNTTNTTQGVRRTCRQDVGSTQTNGIGRAPTSGNNPRTNANQQIVVLRGDLVNICR